MVSRKVKILNILKNIKNMIESFYLFIVDIAQNDGKITAFEMIWMAI